MPRDADYLIRVTREQRDALLAIHECGSAVDTTAASDLVYEWDAADQNASRTIADLDAEDASRDKPA